jgi:hypothetical protein
MAGQSNPLQLKSGRFLFQGARKECQKQELIKEINEQSCGIFLYSILEKNIRIINKCN